MKTSITLILSLAALALVGCTTVAETGRSQFIMPTITPADEAKMGFQSFDDIKKQEKISTNAAANAQVQRVGKRIVASVTQSHAMPDAQWEFVVFESDQVNAFALPGGKVGVYTGLIKLVASDDELAIVMGHEIAHVTCRHGAERSSQQQAASLGQQAATALLNYNEASAATQQIVMTTYGLGAQYGVLLPFSRTHETEADSVGLKFAAGAGYDPRAAAAFWRKMAAASGGASTPTWQSTHPSDESRITNLEKLAPQYMATYEQAKLQYK